MRKFYPGNDEDCLAALWEELGRLCITDEQLDLLSTHFPKVFQEWPGVYELRACACSLFRPADGVEVDSVLFPEGIPTPAELQTPSLRSIPPAARRLDLPAGEQIEANRKLIEAQAASKDRAYSADPELSALVKQKAAELAPMPVIHRRTREQIEADLYQKHGDRIRRGPGSFESDLLAIEQGERGTITQADIDAAIAANKKT